MITVLQIVHVPNLKVMIQTHLACARPCLEICVLLSSLILSCEYLYNSLTYTPNIYIYGFWIFNFL